MQKEKPNIPEEVNHLFIHEYGKLVAMLTKTFGSNNIELAEYVVQDVMIEALNQWSYSGIPDNPIGWIYKVARNKSLSILRRDSLQRNYISESADKILSSNISVQSST